MVLLFSGFVVLRCCGFVVSLFHDFMAFCFNGVMVLFYGLMVA